MQFSILAIIGLLCLGVAAGSLSGLVGIGGGIVMVPALAFFFGFSQHTAQGTSLLALTPPVMILSVLEYYRKGHVNVTAALLIAGGFLLGGLLGGRLANSLPADTIKKIFGVLLLLVAGKLLLGK